MLRFLSYMASMALFFLIILVVVITYGVTRINISIPDYRQLETYEPPVTTRLFAGDGQVMMEYAAEKRLFVPIEKIPDKVKKAFIAAEDKHFYRHSGLDYLGIIRAMIGNLKKMGTGRRPAGASTITQQVAKNFLLSSELSYTRKLKEAILARRINKAFSKEHVLELYLNEIYLGNRAYGVAAAAINYFGKSLDELSLEEIAYMAALPKGPNNYHPQKHYDAAISRRNWVLDRMAEDGYITEEEAKEAKEKPLKVVKRKSGFLKDTEYYSEEVRRSISRNFGDEALYQGGLIVRTTVDPKLQTIATNAFRKGLIAYDSRHGWRGATANIVIDENYKQNLKEIKLTPGAEPTWEKAVVLKVSKDKADIETENGDSGQILLKSLAWARHKEKGKDMGPIPSSVEQVLNKGDVIYAEKDKKAGKSVYNLRQVPIVEGGMAVMDPHTGKVLALVGGFSFLKSQFNRATQAYRQTGSSFKPFVYLTALEEGYSPTDMILDAPFVLDQGEGMPKWKPVNYSKKFYGMMTLRRGVELSKNLMTVRLAQDLGMQKIVDMARRVGVNNNLPPYLSASLGAADTRVIDMVSAYCVIVNGGKKVPPYMIERIQDRKGRTIYKHEQTPCPECDADKWENQQEPDFQVIREQVVDPLSAYQMTSILEGVATRGTGAKLNGLHRHLAGKTGTTNETKDAWFVGFSPDLVVGVYVGFDEPESLGRFETGAQAALPIFYDFMENALKDVPDTSFRIPAGIKLVRVNPQTGRPSAPGDKTVIIEALKPDFDFNNRQKQIGNDENTTAGTEQEARSGLQIGGEY
ncbi:MAG: penicillin-binding protein 1A [Alphaproteobacteria bacterium]|nr:penicillin-binding protein 1A [Alphaproteobacteria bacterium]